MKILRALLLFFAMIVTSGCMYPGITGKVVDSTTGQPIEGAIVLAEWVKVRGLPGLQYHDSHKNIESLTDKNGQFSLSGTIGFLLDPPIMLIYKEGYIPWRNDSIFPSSNTVKDHEWNNKVTYKLDVFTNKYTFEQLHDFMDYGIRGSGGRETPIFDHLMNKLSRRETAELTAQERNNWFNDFRTVIQSLDKGRYSYEDIRSRLMNKAVYEIDWLIDEAKKENSAVSMAMKENGITIEHKSVDSKGNQLYGSLSILFTKR